MYVSKLTAKQKKFADAYIKSGNATQSAIEAGYSKKTARTIGQQNLTKLDIKNYIDERMEKLDSQRIMDAKEAMQLLTSIARGEITETVVLSTPDGLEETEKEADFKTRIVAVKEILKRYPDNDKLLMAQVRKANAEADISEAKARDMNNAVEETEQVVLVDNIEEIDNEED